MHTELWPPLGLIRSALESEPRDGGDNGTGTGAAHDGVVVLTRADAATAQQQQPPPRAVLDALLPLAELARRREALARRAFTARWAPGRLVSVVHEGRLLGVLLDRCVHDRLWQGFMAVGEADWAGAHDVLLEPDDEPFEPLFGMVQAWNVVTLEPSPQLCARVLGEVSATRLAAIRAVHDEWAAQAPLDIAPEPGRIALRSVGGVFSVLSGTPLAAADPRTDYQALYRDVALRLGSALRQHGAEPAAPAPAGRARPAPGPDGGWWGSLRRWFGADGWTRPALAVLALCVVVQNVGVFGGHDSNVDDDAVRFRGSERVPAAAAAARADITVRWKRGVRMEEADRLLQAISADVVGGPGGNGVWRLRVPEPVDALSVLASSPLVDSAGPVEGAQ